jgi:hypothetical protein
VDFADPVVNFLNSNLIYDKNYGNHGQLTKWMRIVSNFTGACKNDPTSSTLILERFIKKTLNEYNLDNISSRISLRDLRGESGDYFLNIIRELNRGLMARGEVLLRRRNIAQYRELCDYYVKHLERRYPFGGLNCADADLETVKGFFKLYDDLGGSPEVILDQIYQLGADARGPYEFLKKVHVLRKFFGEFMRSEYEALKVRLEINFAINKREETNTDYLVDRVFRPNNDSAIEPITPDKSGMWYFGEPIEISLRWANGDAQAPKPIYSQDDPNLSIENSTAKVRSIGNWSVLRFLEKNKAATVSVDLLAPYQRVLEFKIPLDNGKIARVFVGVTASHPKRPGDPSATNVEIPVPVGHAPNLSDAVLLAQNEPVLVHRSVASIFDGDSAASDSAAIEEQNDVEEVQPSGNGGASLEEQHVKPHEGPRERSALHKPAKRNTRSRNVLPKRRAVRQMSPQESAAKKALEVLKSDENKDLNGEEAIVEVTETPIS